MVVIIVSKLCDKWAICQGHNHESNSSPQKDTDHSPHAGLYASQDKINGIPIFLELIDLLGYMLWLLVSSLPSYFFPFIWMLS